MKAIAFLLFAFPITWVSSAAQAQANGHSVPGGRAVDCDSGGVIMQALEKLRSGETLFISGTCMENVEVSDDFKHITLDGAGRGAISAPNPTIDALRIYGDQITVRGLTISGGRDGINLRG